MGRGGASLSKPPQQGERELMGKQVLVFLSQPGEAAEKDAGGGVGVGVGAEQSEGKNRRKRRNVEPEPRSFRTPEHTAGCRVQAVQKPGCQGRMSPPS